MSEGFSMGKPRHKAPWDHNPSPIEQKIKEAMEDAESGIMDRIEEGLHPELPYSVVNEIAHRKANELSQPVQSPSEWIVEVDGEDWGSAAFFEMDNEERVLTTLRKVRDGKVKEFAFNYDDHHIRLLNKDGGVVMDNKVE